MFIQNAVYKTVPTDGLTFPLAEGTVITVGDVTGIVPENIALAAPTGLIYLATGGTIDLTSEANAGVTFTDEQLNELGGDFNFIPLTENGGSSLPSYSSSDIGKVLTVGEGSETVQTVVVPEQTVTIAEENASPIQLAGYDTQFFMSAVEGTEITVTDNVNTVVLTASSMGHDNPGIAFSAVGIRTLIVFFASDYGQFTAGLYFQGAPGSHIVTASAPGQPTPSAVWAAPSQTESVYRFELNVTTPRDVYTAWNSGKVVAQVDVLEVADSFSSFTLLSKMSESNGTYTAYFIAVNNDFSGVNVYSITSGGIDEPFQTL